MKRSLDGLAEEAARLYKKTTGRPVFLVACTDYAAYNVFLDLSNFAPATGRVSHAHLEYLIDQKPHNVAAYLADPPLVAKPCGECGHLRFVLSESK